MSSEKLANVAIGVGCYILCCYGIYKIGEKVGSWLGEKIANSLF